MKIGIIGAIDQEIEMLKKIMHSYTEKKIEDYTIYVGTFKKHNIFLITSGIGKVSASIATMIVIHFYRPKIIINSGSAGSLNHLLKTGDVIIPYQTCYYDVDLINFGYHLGQIPKHPRKFTINPNIFSFFTRKFIEKKLQFTTGLLISGDTFVRNDIFINKLKKKFNSAVAVEMESTAIAQVCYQFKIPLIIIKSISDRSDNNATLNFKQNISIASYQSAKFVKIVLESVNDMKSI